MAAVEAPVANAAVPWTPSVSPWLIAATVMLATFMEVLDTSIANVSLPHIAGSLSATVDESTWVLTSYLISNAIVLPLTGWLSMMFGRKRLFIGCVIIFTISSFLCGLAPNLFLLIFFRVLQGAGGGGLQPISQAILVESFSRQEARHGDGGLRHGRGGGAHHRSHPGRLDHRQLLVALDLLHQRAGRRGGHPDDAGASCTTRRIWSARPSSRG